MKEINEILRKEEFEIEVNEKEEKINFYKMKMRESFDSEDTEAFFYYRDKMNEL